MAVKRNALGVLMGIELVLNGANLNFVAFGSPFLRSRPAGARPGRPVDRHVRDRAGRGRGGRGPGHRPELLQQHATIDVDRRRVERDEMDLYDVLPTLLGLAWLLPLASFVLIVFWGPRMGRGGNCAGYLATLAILLVVLSLPPWRSGCRHHPLRGRSTGAAPWSSRQRRLVHAGPFGTLRLTIGYYIDALTVAMFCMVTLVATCIHVYSFGYMHEELDEVTDPLVTLADGRPLRRRGRFPRFYQYLSLFCFSMLGLVIAGNLAMVFAFWELVGICSYLLIGFYIERKSASNAANKAFIVNRVGDFGMIVGLMAIWTGMGTFSFGDVTGRPTAFRGPASTASTVHHPTFRRAPDGMTASE